MRINGPLQSADAAAGPPEVAVESSGAAGEPPVQFGLRTLLIAQAVCAAFFALLVVSGIFAVIVAFLGTAILARAQVHPKNARLKRITVDVLGGVVLPCLCLAYDPCVFRRDSSLPARGLMSAHVSVLAYLAIGFQMLVLVVWLLAGSRVRRLGGVFAGTLFVGALIALLIGVVLLPMSLFGTLMALIGVLGFVPFMTGWIFLRNANEAFRRARAEGGARLTGEAVLLGVVLAVAIPLLVYWGLGRLVWRVLQSVPWPNPVPFA